MKVLVTGGAGFIGSNFAINYKNKYPEYNIVCLDNLKRRGSELNIPRLKENKINFVHGDVRNKEDLDLKFDTLIECSAEPSILAGQESPEYAINSNLIGAINCLEAARKNKSKFVFLSTSRVYPYDPLLKLNYEEKDTRFEINDSVQGISKEGISENFPLQGTKSIYGATKLCAEHLIEEYRAAYGIETVVNRCGVVGGPWQMGKVDQGLFSLWIAKHYFNNPLSYIGFGGKGKQVRDILHVNDLCDLIDLQINNLDKCNGKVYNVGGGKENNLSLLETTKLCEEITGNKIKINSVEETRPADIPYYTSDMSYLNKDFDWKPKKSSKETLQDICSWIKENESELKEILM